LLQGRPYNLVSFSNLHPFACNEIIYVATFFFFGAKLPTPRPGPDGMARSQPTRQRAGCAPDADSPTASDAGSAASLLERPAAAVTPPCYVPRRAITAVFLFLGLSVVYALRVCISIAAVPGTAANNSTGAVLTMYSEFHWSNTDQGIVLGAFFNGYIFTQILGGMLSRRFGGKPVLLGCVALASFFTAITPLAASLSFPLLVACRTCLGAVEGVSFPAVMSMLVDWAAPAERSITVGFVFAGAYIGNVGTFLLGGWILEVYGWRAIFYSLSLVGLVWCLLFALLTAASPSRALKHRLLRIHPAELALLTAPPIVPPEPAHVGTQMEEDGSDVHAGDLHDVRDVRAENAQIPHLAPDDMEEPFLRRADAVNPEGDGEDANRERQGSGSPLSVPWAKIARSPACWGIFVGHTAFNFSFYLLLTQLPSYLRLVVGLSGEDAAYASALPYLLMLVLSISGGMVADTLIASRTLSNVSTRRLMTSAGLVGSAMCLVAAGFAAPPSQHAATSLLHPPPAVLLVTLGLGVAAICNSGYNANYLEVGGRFSGVLLSVGNTLATLPGILAPVLTGVVVDSYGCRSSTDAVEDKCRAAYQTIFLMVFGVNIVGAGVCGMLTSSNPL